MEWLLHHLETHLFDIGRTPVTPLSVLVFLLILVLAVTAGRLLRTGLVRFARRRRANEGVAYAVGRILQYAVVVTGVLIAMGSIGIDLTALAAAGALLTVGIGLGLQNTVHNFFSGIVLLLERPVQKGDFVQIGDTVGTVRAVSLRSTRVVSRDGVSIIVPNSKLTSDTVINQSQPTSTYRVRVEVGVAYGSDTELVRDTLLAIGGAHPAVLADPPPRVFFPRLR